MERKEIYILTDARLTVDRPMDEGRNFQPDRGILERQERNRGLLFRGHWELIVRAAGFLNGL